jgi:hypothetical protein
MGGQEFALHMINDYQLVNHQRSLRRGYGEHHAS